MMPRAKTVARDEAAAQRVVQAEEAGGGRVADEVGHRLDVHAGREDVRAHSVDHQRKQRETDLPLQLGIHPEAGPGRGGHSAAIFPPACSILLRAEPESVTPLTT